MKTTKEIYTAYMSGYQSPESFCASNNISEDFFLKVIKKHAPLAITRFVFGE